jgi:hypothetical protein
MTMEGFGWKVLGEMEPCDGCLQFKAKAKGGSHKPTKIQATESGERLFLDTTGPYQMSAGGTKYNVHVVDKKTNMGWVAHVVQRNAVPKKLESHCKFLKGRGFDVKYRTSNKTKVKFAKSRGLIWNIRRLILHK